GRVATSVRWGNRDSVDRFDAHDALPLTTQLGILPRFTYGEDSMPEIQFQLSLDQRNLDEAVEMAALGAAAGIHVIEAGTILILSEGAQHVIPTLKERFPGYPIVADVKCTDGVGPEVGLMFELGAAKATVMASAS